MEKVFVMTKDAVENYGEEWREVRLVPTSKANKYMPAKEFYAKGSPSGFHPGYDGSGEWLYDLMREDTREALSFSLYSWELRNA